MVECGELGPRRGAFRSREEVAIVQGISNQKKKALASSEGFFLSLREGNFVRVKPLTGVLPGELH